MLTLDLLFLPCCDTQMDLPSSYAHKDRVERCTGLPVVPISALTGDGVQQLTLTLRSVIEHFHGGEQLSFA